MAFVIGMATRDLRPWRRTLKHIRALPESGQPGKHQPELTTMTAFPFQDDVGAATEAYAAYVNAPQGTLDSDDDGRASFKEPDATLRGG
ncbi:MAG: hypothetical protein WAN22_08915 [Solirubrobacteraceae bacterium]